MFSLPGNTFFLAHTLTNTGTVADTFTVTATDLGGGWNLQSRLFLDANGDGQPDSGVPLASPIVLAPGQVLRFVVRLNVPVSGFTANDARVRIDATSVGGAVVAPVTDTVSLLDNTPRDCAVAGKSLSRINGPSPLPLVTVTIAYSPCDKARSKLFIADKLPAGMRYIAGSGRWSGTGAAALSDAVNGNDREGAGSTQIAYDWNVTAPGTVTAWVYNIPANSQGSITFNVAIEPGIAIGTEVVNTAEWNYYSASGSYELRQFTSATYTVDGTIDLRLTGAHVPTANPGTTVTFTNVLTNLGTLTDTFDITLGSTFPAGTVITLFKTDGVTPLADTDGNGTPDTGPLAPGASYNIVVKVALPETTPSGAYKVSKTARSAAAPSRFVTVDDSVDAVAQACRVALEPDNQALIGRGQHVTYTHYLTNRGNCQETVRAMLDYLGDSKAGLDLGRVHRQPRRGRRLAARRGRRDRHAGGAGLVAGAAAGREPARAGGRARAGIRGDQGRAQTDSRFRRDYARHHERDGGAPGGEGHHAHRRGGRARPARQRDPQLHRRELRDADLLGGDRPRPLHSRRRGRVQRRSRRDRVAHRRDHRRQRRARGSRPPWRPGPTPASSWSRRCACARRPWSPATASSKAPPTTSSISRSSAAAGASPTW